MAHFLVFEPSLYFEGSHSFEICTFSHLFSKFLSHNPVLSPPLKPSLRISQIISSRIPIPLSEMVNTFSCALFSHWNAIVSAFPCFLAFFKIFIRSIVTSPSIPSTNIPERDSSHMIFISIRNPDTSFTGKNSHIYSVSKRKFRYLSLDKFFRNISHKIQ